MKNFFPNIMIINFQMLSSGMQDRIGRKSNDWHIITPYDKNIGKKNSKLLEQNS